MSKILSLSTSLSGGGGKAAASLNRILSLEHEVITISRENIRNFQEFSPLEYAVKFFFGKVNTLINRKKTHSDYGFVSSRSVGFLSLSTIRELKPDVIHIHNWYNLLDLKTIAKVLSEFKVVFISHDTRIISGGCHVLLGCKNFTNGCRNCPAIKYGNRGIEKSWKAMRLAINNSIDLSIVSPSDWLSKEIKLEYPAMRVLKIPNVVDSTFFNQTDYIPRTRIERLLFVSASLASPFKGAANLIQAMNILQSINPTRSWTLTLVGTGNVTELQHATFNYSLLGSVNSSELLEIYQNHDLLVIPSLSDNFPTVAIEAQLSGIPILATRIGGLIEIIDDKHTGFLTSPSPNLIASAISNLDLEELNQVGAAAHAIARAKYNPLTIASQYEGIFK